MVLAFVNVAADPDHVVDVNEPVVPLPTNTFWTLISPEASLATNLLAVFALSPCTLNVAADAPLKGPPTKKEPAESAAGVEEPTAATFDHTSGLPAPSDFKKYPDVPGVSFVRDDVLSATSICPIV